MSGGGKAGSAVAPPSNNSTSSSSNLSQIKNAQLASSEARLYYNHLQHQQQQKPPDPPPFNRGMKGGGSLASFQGTAAAAQTSQLHANGFSQYSVPGTTGIYFRYYKQPQDSRKKLRLTQKNIEISNIIFL